MRSVRPSSVKPAPFICSFDARRRVRAFIKEQPDMDARLTLVKGGEMRDPKGETALVKLHGDHFFLDRQRKGQLPEESFYLLAGERISIESSALEKLKGKRLVEKFYSFGPRHFLTFFVPRYQMHVLASEPVPGEFLALEPDGILYNRPLLEQNETILRSFDAFHTQGRLMVNGRLYLTSSRLVFAPDRNTVDSAVHGWQVARGSILKVAQVEGSHRLRDFFSGAMRTRVSVTTTLGQTAFFRADSPAELLSGLEDYIKTDRAEPVAAPGSPKDLILPHTTSGQNAVSL